jgi:hypothetical protein
VKFKLIYDTKLNDFNEQPLGIRPLVSTHSNYTYRSLFIPEGVAETSQIFPQDTLIFPKYLAMIDIIDFYYIINTRRE